MDASEQGVTKRGLEGSARLRLVGIRQLRGYMAQKSREARQRRRIALEIEGDAN